jgi:hypothetical protein
VEEMEDRAGKKAQGWLVREVFWSRSGDVVGHLVVVIKWTRIMVGDVSGTFSQCLPELSAPDETKL